jgi:uncharacterized protein involved in cysteine biosynthesis
MIILTLLSIAILFLFYYDNNSMKIISSLLNTNKDWSINISWISLIVIAIINIIILYSGSKLVKKYREKNPHTI